MNDKLKSKTFGVIIPIYNTKKEWFLKAIDSAIKSYFAVDKDFEIIIIDNGSDNKDIWKYLNDNYKKYDFIKLKRFDKNEGKQKATKYGFYNLNAKYFQVLDSDDWIDSNKIKNIINILKKVDGDIFFLNYYYFNDKKQTIRKERKIYKKSPLDYVKLENIPRSFWHFNANTIFNKKFMINNNFKFPETKIYYEDAYMNMWNLSKIRNPYFINDSFYYYRVNIGGTNLSSTNKMFEYIDYFEKMYRETIKLDFSNKITRKNMINLSSLQFLTLSFFWTSKEKFNVSRKKIKILKKEIKENKNLYYAKGLKRPRVTIIGDLLIWNGYLFFLIKPFSKLFIKFRR
ncbi:Glycosyl transferase family 2 [Candidatus Hepatoplasma crinochetorum Av]|uniref:Glycosyl transferase family 2 n=1 Tax=Candidatus Hepatoplasma crinochetorum Av TaxID=1427984 RepID=W8GMC0_9MOLU|nr:glycosyltransferase family 2 protein [Candidatus Hepatoplasma crinochetorum]AHK22166.1 Glycosyl transferase family 2 [Candidatus Hepatoplasma crinochetorum Av]